MKSQNLNDDALKRLQLTAAGAVIEVTLDFGPRIISLKKPGGAEIMQWSGKGGARVWPASGPQADETHLSYAPDNEPCNVTFMDNNSVVEIWGAVNKTHWMQRGFRICENLHGGFDVTSMIRNCSPHGLLLNAGVWAIAAVQKDCTIGILLGDPDSNWSTSLVQYVWDWAGHSTTSEFLEQQMCLQRGLLTVTPGGHEGKIMARSNLGTIVTQGHGVAFWKFIPYDARLNGLHPDCCNVAIYTSPGTGPNAFAESETMGPIGRIKAGQVLEHTERWVLGNMVDLDDVPSLCHIARGLKKG